MPLEPIQRVLDWFDKTFLAIRQHEARQGRPLCLTCRKGCAACCSEQVITIDAEAALIVASLSESEREQLKAKVQAWLARVKEIGLEAYCGPEHQFDATDYRRFKIPCPLLTDEGLCSVYAQRPLSCRMFMTGGPRLACENLKLRPYQKFVTIVELKNAAYHSMIGAAQQAGYTRLGLSHLGYLLAIELGLVTAEDL